MKKSKPYLGKAKGAMAAWVPWEERTRSLSLKLVQRNRCDPAYVRANCASVQRAIDGMGPDGSKVDPRAGARMTVNLSAAHIPAFCEASRSNNLPAYKNCYDLAAMFPDKPDMAVKERRREVDLCLPLATGATVERTYFGAVELSGAGIRFYGDICLVLKREVTATSVILDRNSYDLVRPPVKQQIDRFKSGDRFAARKAVARSWSGNWGDDIAHVASVRALGALTSQQRRWTTGQIAAAVRSDEDYIEVLKAGSFVADDLQEARIAASDAARDASTAASLQHKSPPPRLEALIAATYRRSAETALRDAGIAVRIVGDLGRTKD